MSTYLKVFDSKRKKFIDPEEFFINSEGGLVVMSELGRYMCTASDVFKPLFGTGKTDKNGVELYIGDRMRNKNGHEFTLKFSIEGMDTCEKIGSKYTEK